MPYAKNTLKVNVVRRSGFDKSHRNTGTSFCGTLTPLLCDELIPNSRVSLRIPINVQLPPLVSETYMNVRYEIQAFFVPSRLLCKSFEAFFCDSPLTSLGFTAGGSNYIDVNGRVPYFNLQNSASVLEQKFGPGSLADFLGLRIQTGSNVPNYKVNSLPFVAYHLVWQEWYRNPRVQRACFAPPVYENTGAVITRYPSVIPYTFYHDTIPASGTSAQIASNLELTPTQPLADGVSIFDLRQRNFDSDYFTGARVSAQQGAPAAVTFDTSGDEGTMTISALRAANSLQQFRERNNLPSQRLVDQVKARYGASLSDGVAQRPICIGSASFEVYSRGVDQTGVGSGGNFPNPFSGVAAQYGRASANGNEFIIDDFTANEPGYLLVLGSLVPEVSYSFGVSPMFLRYLEDGSITQMACSLLQNVGDQPIYVDELNGAWNDQEGSRYVFGFTDRFADFMFMPNAIHGEMREGQSLDAFVLQRNFLGATEISSAFLQIPKDYMDGVLAVSSAASSLTYWYDSILQYHVSMPLAEFSLPSLQDPGYEHGQPVILRRNGQIF